MSDVAIRGIDVHTYLVKDPSTRGAAADYYRARGANVMPEIVDNEHCLMAFVEDTEGNHFILHQCKG